MRTGIFLAATGLLVGALSACSPQPEPAPTKTAPFESEDEAFDAAEETYRAYNDAVNKHRHEESSEDPGSYLIGQAFEARLEGERQVEAAGLRLEGNVVVTRFVPLPGDFDPAQPRLRATACLDLTDTRVTVVATGEEADIPERPTSAAQEVEMTWIKDSFLISQELEGEAAECASP